MAGYSIEYDFQQVEGYFDKLSFEAVDTLNNFIGNELIAVSMEAFEGEKDPETGKPWPKSNRAENTGGKTLLDKGNLRASIAYNIIRDGVEAGTPLLYGRIHMTGEVIRAKKDYMTFKIGNQFVRKKELRIPQRRFLGVPADFEKRVFGDPGITRLFEAG